MEHLLVNPIKLWSTIKQRPNEIRTHIYVFQQTFFLCSLLLLGKFFTNCKLFPQTKSMAFMTCCYWIIGYMFNIVAGTTYSLIVVGETVVSTLAH